MERYKRVLERAKTAKLEVLTIWHQFQMKQDPFMSPISAEETEYFVDREEVLEEIIFQIGVAKRGIPITMLLVGPVGSGRTAVLNQVNNIIKKLRDDNPEKYPFEGSIFTAEYLFSPPEELEEEQFELQPWVLRARERKDYLLVDDAKTEHIKTTYNEFINTNFKLFSVSPFYYDEVVEALPFTPHAIFLRPLDFDDSVSMLEKRIQMSLLDSEKLESIGILFDNEALRYIWECSMRVPLLILRNASKCFEFLIELEAQKVSTEIAARACKATKCDQAKQGIEDITKTKRELLGELLEIGRTPTELSSILQKDRTTISRQLNDLRKAGLVNLRQIGRRSIYKATESAQIALQLKAMPKGW